MNFLEQLAAEWYEYQGYFTRTNIRFGKNAHGKGGNVGEIDVIAYHPQKKKFIHIESSAEVNSWDKIKKKFIKKFSDARGYYQDIFPFKDDEIELRQIAIVGYNRNHHKSVDSWYSNPPKGSMIGPIKIEVIHIPAFVSEITSHLKNKDPFKEGIPETLPLLRTIQYSSFYKDKK